jgi:DNA (cytosine-5)-methyltransferase 1
MEHRPKILNLYAGVGGNRKLWEDVSVTAIEKDAAIAAVYKKLYPQDLVLVADAHHYLQKNFRDFDIVWSSPPCYTHTAMAKFTRHKVRRYPDLKLYEEIIFLQHHFPGHWIVENVIPYYEPLIPGRKVDRHLFWSNFPITPYEMVRPKGFITLDGDTGRAALMGWLGIRFEERLYSNGNHSLCQVLRNCVHPLLGKHVFDCLISHRDGKKLERSQHELF